MKNPVIRYLLKNQFIMALLIVTVGWIVLQIKGTLIAFFISYILMATLSPYVEFLHKRRFPRILAVSIPFLAAVAFLLLLIIPLFPFFIRQIAILINQLPTYLSNESALSTFGVDSGQINELLSSQFGNISRNALSLTGAFFSSVFQLITIFVVSFYLLLYHSSVKKGIASLFPGSEQRRVERTLHNVDERLGSWLRGQIILSVFIGVITYIILSVLQVEFALSLALLAGLLEIIPTIGPLIAAIPAIIIALNTSIPMAIIVAGVYLAIQVLENNVLVPRIMEKAVGLNPIIVILGIVIGGRLLGVAGALLSIPFISLCIVLYNSLQEENAVTLDQ